ncbi:MAG: fumarylacetoacetate hydrolase family protein [Christensenella sp.]|uniref:fumarylacetoacetate hydrolase family protein n=1 Tax=Christensenella sp. TaxID=1935934 RepID=UPI002B20F8B7|nr:fumarylacetoacetate hydrolase family protein [Christensenella sp.]MEA5004299.1 fumarylacetoacetate hydrolase family protein [Christensenella sp.]
MRFGRVRIQQGDFYAELSGGQAKLLVGTPYETVAYTGEELALEACTLLAPAKPKNIVAVGLNYQSHATEIAMTIPKEPLIFSKFISSILVPGGVIVKPPQCERLDYEAELAFVVGKKCRNVRKENAAEYIFGYTCLNDVTARDLQKTDGQWARCKGFDTFCPFGPWIETEFDPTGAHVRAILNGKTVQEGNTSDFIFDAYTLLAYISSFMTLMPGDVVTMGTPGGIGPMQPGDEISIVIDGIGELRNTVGK